MKHTILLLTLFTLIFSSCEDFLEERSHDRIIPKSAKDYSEMLYGEAYLKEHDEFVKYIELMTDDVKDVYVTSNTDVRADGWGYYTWQQDPQSRRNGTVFIDNTWANFYKSILACNITINDINLGKVEGELADIQDVKAEAHFLRAWYYLTLVNLFGEPYDAATADKALGVPINNLTEANDTKFNRSSLKDCYTHIENDILESIRLFKASQKNKTFFRANINAAYLLASRTFLYEQKWEKAKLYADSTLRKKPALLQFTSNRRNWWYGKYGRVIKKKNPEILFTYADGSLTFYPEGATGYFKQSDELLNMYSDDDNRKYAFFCNKYSWLTNYMPLKYGDPSVTGAYGFAFRSVEAYLNRAEALTHIDGKFSEAIEDINTIRKFRYAKGKVDNASATSAQDALDIVKKERRLELCFEGFRWFDLRRWDRPRIEHFYTTSNVMGAGETFVLEENDPAYTLPLPTYIRDINMEIKRINRPVRQAIK
jgi:hypothetical protein